VAAIVGTFADMPSPSTASPLTLLEEAVARAGPVRGLSPERYATTHAAFEDASDQRGRIRRWLVDEVPALLAGAADRPVAVLGVGVGDGSVDAPLAARLAADDRAVDYHGVEPHGPSLERFGARLRGLGRPQLEVTTSRTDLAGYTGRGPFDLVHFVHSLYYVPDVGAAVEHAMGLLRTGGRLVALTSPLEPLSVLASLLAPQVRHPQWFAERIADELVDRGFDPVPADIEGRLDLTVVRDDPDGRGEDVLDFLIQARSADLDPEVRELVDTHLAEIALPGEPHVVPHPLHAMVVTAP
jgi:SAM-dependent methyltransferase